MLSGCRSLCVSKSFSHLNHTLYYAPGSCNTLNLPWNLTYKVNPDCLAIDCRTLQFIRITFIELVRLCTWQGRHSTIASLAPCLVFCNCRASRDCFTPLVNGSLLSLNKVAPSPSAFAGDSCEGACTSKRQPDCALVLGVTS